MVDDDRPRGPVQWVIHGLLLAAHGALLAADAVGGWVSDACTAVRFRAETRRQRRG